MSVTIKYKYKIKIGIIVSKKSINLSKKTRLVSGSSQWLWLLEVKPRKHHGAMNSKSSTL